jgi:hypothetical protein
MSTCPKCGGRIIVVNSLRISQSRIRYRGCRQCGYRPPDNKRVVPLSLSSNSTSSQPTNSTV